MAKTTGEITQVIKTYLKLLSENIKVEKAILFGSYATGHPDQWSDIDLAVISPDFRLRDHLKNLQLLSSLNSRELNWLIEALPYTPEEYENAESRSFLGEIKRTGIVVHQSRNSPS
jgi:predicted nucleotidyltransferase